MFDTLTGMVVAIGEGLRDVVRDPMNNPGKSLLVLGGIVLFMWWVRRK